MSSSKAISRSKRSFMFFSVKLSTLLILMFFYQHAGALTRIIPARRIQHRLQVSFYKDNKHVTLYHFKHGLTTSPRQCSHRNLVFRTNSNRILRTLLHSTDLSSSFNTDDDLDENVVDISLSSSRSSSSVLLNGDNFALDPYSELVQSITSSLGLSESQHEKLTSLACLVVEWNERLNLISRKDCSIPIVFGRHILPSIAIGAVSPSSNKIFNNYNINNASDPATTSSILSGIFSSSQSHDTGDNNIPKSSPKKIRVIDVGTGGGFPGLPLAILFPHIEFLLIDSIGKKLKAIEEMTQALKVMNVKTYHGRVEEMSSHPIHGLLHKNAYDFCVGRSVASLPTFCFWVQDLIKQKDGQLLYIIGGEIDPYVQSRISRDIPINDIFQRNDVSDKRILIFSSKHVVDIAARSGEKKKIIGVPKIKSKNKLTEKNAMSSSSSSTYNTNRSTSSSQGAWKKRDNSMKKDRGYDDFQRFES